jgi:MOSC domain-containing protein YiiM
MQPDPVWTAQDLAGTLRAVEPWWELAVAGLEPPLPADVAAARARIDDLVAAVRDGDDPAARERAGTALVAELSAAGRAALAAGSGARGDRGPLASGRVVGLHVSPGGVPKAPVSEADIGWRGLAGDRQATRRHHGRLWQAVCLWSAEVIDGLRRDGHPIFPGAAGENVTVAGLDWAALRPGLRLAAGNAVVEVTVPALPCAANAGWFADGDVMRIDHRRHPGSSRQYALVVRPGRVAVGDDVMAV